MQASEATETAVVETTQIPDLELTPFIPDWLDPAWEFFSPFPGLLTLLLIVVAYGFGKLLRATIYHTGMKIASKTATGSDDHMVEYLTKPLVLTTVILALMLAVSAYPLPWFLQNVIRSTLATILLFSWLRAFLRAAREVLELIGNAQHRFELIQERTIPVFSLTIKI